MNVAVNTLPLTSGHSNRGIGGYTKNLLQALENAKTKHTFIPFEQEQQLPKTIDLVHYPFFDPFFLTMPLMKRFKRIVTVHDLIPILFPQQFPKGVKGSIIWHIQKMNVKKSDRIITDSNNSRSDIQKILGFDRSKIDVIPLAPSIQEPSIQSDWKQGKESLGIRKKFLLYVGDINWNKNIPGLLRGFSQYLEHSDERNTQLVLVGKSFLSHIKEAHLIKELIHTLNIGGNVILPGYVDDATVVQLYKHAEACIQPSFYEGFGLPILEAMKFGCPVITSFTSSLQEIAGPSIQINPESPQSISQQIAFVTHMADSDRKTLIDKGFRFVTEYSWEKVASQTIESYEKAVI